MAECIICPKKAELRCSQCKRVSFCGQEHHKLFWPYHRVQCKAGSDAFVFPPLEPDEANALVVVRDQAVTNYGEGMLKTVPHFLRDKGLYGGTLPALVATLSQPAPQNKRRTTILALTIQHLHVCFTEALLPANESSSPEQTPWQGVSPYVVNLLLPGLSGSSSLTQEGEPLEVANQFLQHLLVATSLLHEYKKLDRGVGFELLDWCVLAYKLTEMMASMAKQGVM
ncbi:hypothetical protein JCM6882_005079 [Rhodosporidiobolus microsporus]